MKRLKGFTLVEILVVMAILSVVGVIITTIFIRNLRGSNKSQIISQIKQNGQTVLETMDKTIKNADNLVCISNNPDNTLVVEKRGSYTRFRIVPGTDTVNGSIGQDNPEPCEGESCEVDESDPKVFINRVCNPNDPLSFSSLITDTNPQTGVKVVRGAFSEADKEQSAGFKKAVKIFFVLGHGIEAAPAVAGQIDPVTFETTVQLR